MPALNVVVLTHAEKAAVQRLQQHVQRHFGMDLARYLVMELQEGRVLVLDRDSIEFRGLTTWH